MEKYITITEIEKFLHGDTSKFVPKLPEDPDLLELLAEDINNNVDANSNTIQDVRARNQCAVPFLEMNSNMSQSVDYFDPENNYVAELLTTQDIGHGNPLSTSFQLNSSSTVGRVEDLNEEYDEALLNDSMTFGSSLIQAGQCPEAQNPMPTVGSRTQNPMPTVGLMSTVKSSFSSLSAIESFPNGIVFDLDQFDNTSLRVVPIQEDGGKDQSDDISLGKGDTFKCQSGFSKMSDNVSSCLEGVSQPVSSNLHTKTTPMDKENGCFTSQGVESQVCAQTPEDIKKAKRHKNKIAARKSRKKKKDDDGRLEKENRALETSSALLESQNAELEEKIKTLNESLKEFENDHTTDNPVTDCPSSVATSFDLDDKYEENMDWSEDGRKTPSPRIDVVTKTLQKRKSTSVINYYSPWKIFKETTSDEDDLDSLFKYKNYPEYDYND